MGHTPEQPPRHRDSGVWLPRYAGRILVVCPRCGGRADVVVRPGAHAPGNLLFAPRRLSCAGCGATAGREAPRSGNAKVAPQLGGTEEPFFGQPLWLQTRCAGRILWAFDHEHAAALAAFVGARLRENGGSSPTRAMIPRLPAWMKQAGNREPVLAGLARLRALAGRTAPADRSDAAHPRGDRPRPYRALHFGR